MNDSPPWLPLSNTEFHRSLYWRNVKQSLVWLLNHKGRLLLGIADFHRCLPKISTKDEQEFWALEELLARYEDFLQKTNAREEEIVQKRSSTTTTHISSSTRASGI